MPEKVQIQVNRISMCDYEALHYDKEQLREACEYLFLSSSIVFTALKTTFSCTPEKKTPLLSKYDLI